MIPHQLFQEDIVELSKGFLMEVEGSGRRK